MARKQTRHIKDSFSWHHTITINMEKKLLYFVSAGHVMYIKLLQDIGFEHVVKGAMLSVFGHKPN